MPVFAQYDFNDSGTTAADSALGNGAQNGVYLNGASASGGAAQLDGVDDLIKIYHDPSFNLARGTVDITFTSSTTPATSTQTILSRDSTGEHQGGFRAELLTNGSMLITHETNGGAVTYSTPAGFSAAGDELRMVYSWDAENGGRVVVQNLTAGTEFSQPTPPGLTMDQAPAGMDQPWMVGAGQSNSDPDILNNVDQHFHGSVSHLSISDTVDNGGPLPGRDGIVMGTDEDDLIDGNYVDPTDGDVIDGNDAIIPGDGPNDDRVYAGAGNDTVYSGLGNDLVYGGTGNDLIYGGVGDDTLHGDQGRDTLFGDAGNDVIYGGGGADLIFGGEGNDELYGGNGADTLFGGTGEDTIYGGFGSDVVFGGDGDDEIYGGNGADTLHGDAGDDTIYGGYGADVVFGGDGDDRIYGGAGADTLFGDAGDDTIFGGNGNDAIFGGDGNDLLFGGNGSDTIYGGAGNDTIIGGPGADLLFGGDDRDVFIIDAPEHGHGDTIDGGEGGDDYDTLDLRGAGPLRITYSDDNPENGIVTFLDADGNPTGTLEFYNIENVIPCFTPGTMIATPRGEIPVEQLKVGDRVITRDNGIQQIRWIGQKPLSWSDMQSAPHLRPILVRQGSLGNGLPERDLIVSPNHRLLVANDRTTLYFEEHEVLVAAKHLISGRDIREVDSMGTTYIHFMFDHHEVVLSNGAWTESFQPGDYTLKGMGNAQRGEIFELFPDLKTPQGRESWGTARRILKRHEARLLVR